MLNIFMTTVYFRQLCDADTTMLCEALETCGIFLKELL